MSKIKQNIPLAIILSILSSFVLAAGLSLTKTGFQDSSSTEIAFFRSLTVFILTALTAFGVHRKETIRSFLKTKFLKMHAIRSATTVLALYLFLYALHYNSLTEVSLFSSTTPLFTPFIALLWKKTSIDHALWPAIVLAFLGIGCILQPEQSENIIGLGAALLSAVLCAVGVVALKIANNEEPVTKTIFYYTLFSSLFTGIIYVTSGVSGTFLQNTPTLWALLKIGAAAFIYQYLFSFALKYGPAKLIAPLSYLSIFFTLLLDILFWNHSITSSEVVGAVLLLLGLLLMIVIDSYRKKKLLSSEAAQSTS